MATILIASKLELDFLKMYQEFEDRGMELRLVQDELALSSALTKFKPKVVFLDQSFCEESLRVLKDYKDSASMKWVYCLRQSRSMANHHRAYNSGAYLVLEDPRTVEQYVLRAKQVLMNNIPEEDLPQGMDEQVEQSVLENWLFRFSSVLRAHELAFASLQEESHRFLKELADENQWGVLDLISYRPIDPLDSSLTRVRSVVSSKTSGFGLPEFIGQFPELQVAARSGRVVFSNESNRAYLKRFVSSADALAEVSVAVIPLKSFDGRVLGALRVSLPQPLSPYLEQAVLNLERFSSSLFMAFSRLDFFSRIYSQPENFYKVA